MKSLALGTSLTVPFPLQKESWPIILLCTRQMFSQSLLCVDRITWPVIIRISSGNFSPIKSVVITKHHAIASDISNFRFWISQYIFASSYELDMTWYVNKTLMSNQERFYLPFRLTRYLCVCSYYVTCPF